MLQSKVMCYKAREDLTVNNLPIFFGRVEIQGERVSGKHYRARVEKVSEDYLIGFYWLELDAHVFFQKFEEHGDVEITEEEFGALLDQWTQHGTYPAFCWNPEENPQAVQS